MVGFSNWLIVAILSWAWFMPQERINYAEFLAQLVLLEDLAKLPAGGEKQYILAGDDCSTGYYDPPISNHGNKSSDGTKLFPRKDGNDLILAEFNGPGMINWLWFALPGEGHLKIFLDGAETPIFNGSISELYGSYSRMYPNLVYRAGRSINFFIPIPFQESCKIVGDKDFGGYYRIGYKTYERGKELPSLKGGFGKDERVALDQLNTILGQREYLSDRSHNGESTDTIIVSIQPGETLTVFHSKATRAISSMNVFLELGKIVPEIFLRQEGQSLRQSGGRRIIPDTPDDRDVLRELVLAIYWDGDKNPAVWSPLGDFFGTAPGWNTYRSLTTGMTPDKLYSHWFMPFRNEALITLHNDGLKARKLTFEVTHVPISDSIESYGRFHALWMEDSSIRKQFGEQEKKWTLLKTKGKGRFCGIMLDARNPTGKWWGDCTYSFTVDQGKTPSVKGYGLDSYFGTWGNNFFSEAFHAHTLTDRSMTQREHESLNRWHITDNIPFHESLDIRFDLNFPDSDSISYNATLFWYQEESRQETVMQAPLEKRIDPQFDTEFGQEDCLEGEDMDIAACTGGITTPLYVEGLHTGGWSGMRGKEQLWWKGINIGDTLRLSLPVKVDAEYKMRAQFIKGEEYGQFSIYLDEKLISDSLNLNFKILAPSGPIDYGIHRLTKGIHSLMIIARKSYSSESDTFQFGLDYIQLETWHHERNPYPKLQHVVAGDFVNIYNQNNTNDHCFIQGSDGIWHFYGIGGGRGFTHGTSENLNDQNWTPQSPPFPVEWNPWKEMHLWAPHVVKHDSTYYMYYCAGGKTGAIYRMHLATSDDLINWTRHTGNPLFIDGFDARDPMVIKVGDQWVLYYCANSKAQGGNNVVAYRLSKDLVNWSERHIAFVDPRRHKAGGPTESPFVVRRGDTFYLFIGPREGYVGTDVFASKDPFKWHLEDKVGHIDSHAAEVVRDSDGKWYVSHSGVGEGGLFLAPLYWNDGLDDEDTSLPVPELIP
ncbi:MAG: DUF2961 domain-containing protein [Bacteroidales bacterium]|nr:DUF2961 domain-containing protein [Bacteroidales bacterium]